MPEPMKVTKPIKKYLFCCKPPDGSLLHLIQNLLFTNFAALLE